MPKAIKIICHGGPANGKIGTVYGYGDTYEFFATAQGGFPPYTAIYRPRVRLGVRGGQDAFTRDSHDRIYYDFWEVKPW